MSDLRTDLPSHDCPSPHLEVVFTSDWHLDNPGSICGVSQLVRLKSFFCHSTGTDTEYRQVFSMRRWRRSASRPSRVCLSIQLKAQWFSSRSRSRTASCEVPLPREFAQDFQGSRLSCFESHTMLICSSQIRSAYSRAASRHRARSSPRYFFVLFKTDFRTAPEAPVGQRSLIRRLRLPSIRAILAMRDGCA